MEAHYPVVKHVALKMYYQLMRKVPLEDLIGDGCVGLCDAIERFNPARGVKFTTYAPQRIRGAILDAIRKRDWVPRLVRSRGEHVRHLQSMHEPTVNGDRGDRTTLGATLADPKAAAGIEHCDEVDVFDRIMAGFARAERMLVRLYYGEQMTMKEIGRVLDLSESRVSQMHSAIIARLRAKPAAAKAMMQMLSRRTKEA